MTVLVTTASKHGVTLEIAETIARVLEESGIEAEFIELDEVAGARSSAGPRRSRCS